MEQGKTWWQAKWSPTSWGTDHWTSPLLHTLHLCCLSINQPALAQLQTEVGQTIFLRRPHCHRHTAPIHQPLPVLTIQNIDTHWHRGTLVCQHRKHVLSKSKAHRVKMALDLIGGQLNELWGRSNETSTDWWEFLIHGICLGFLELLELLETI